jgi:hypothetical protein
VREHRAGLVRSGDVVRTKILLGATLLLVVLVWLLWPASAPAPGATPVAQRAEATEPPRELPPLPPQIERALPDGGVASSTTVSVLLYGFVRDSQGQPIAAATVRARPHRRGEALVARTGAEGEYVIMGVPPVLDAIEVTATGYTPTTTTSPSLPGLASRRVRYDVVLAELPGIRGLVRCDGQPVARARVLAEPNMPDTPEHDGARRRHGMNVLAAAQTGPDGRFMLELEPIPAEVRVRVWSGTCGEGDAVSVQGAAVTIDLAGGGTIAGRAIDAKTKRPVPSFWVSASSLLRDSGGPPAMAVDDERGEFLLGPLAPGRQRIYVAAAGYQPASQDVELAAQARLTDVVVELTRSVELRGRVVDARTRLPIEGATVSPAEWAAEVLSDAVGATTGPDGRYVLTTLPGKLSSVVASARGYRTLMQGGVNGRASRGLTLDLELMPLDVDGARASNELVGIGAQLQMGRDGVQVMGVVEGGPAASKLRPGDVIVKVGDMAVQNLELGDVVQAIRGELGTEVELWVRRGNGEPQRIVFERKRVSWTPR